MKYKKFAMGLLLLAGAWLLLKLLPRVDYFKPMIAPKETAYFFTIRRLSP